MLHHTHLLSFLLLVPLVDPAADIHCYSDPQGGKLQQCEAKLGYRTCFTKLDIKGRVLTRGCSTKRPVFHVECENHVSGPQRERFCYCSHQLCNSSPSLVTSLSPLSSLLPSLLLFLSLSLSLTSL